MIYLISLFTLFFLNACNSIEVSDLEEVENGGFILKNGSYTCDSTSILASDNLKFIVEEKKVTGTYNFPDNYSSFLYNDTIIENTGTFEGAYILTQNEFKLFGNFYKNARISKYDTLKILQGYHTKSGYLIDNVKYSTDTLKNFSGMFKSSYHFSPTIWGPIISNVDTTLVVESEELIWRSDPLIKALPPSHETIMREDTLIFTEIKGDFNSNFRIRRYGDFTMDVVKENYWLYCKYN